MRVGTDYFYAFFKRFHNVAGKHVPAMSAVAAAEAGVASVLLTNPLWEVNLRQVCHASVIAHLHVPWSFAALLACDHTRACADTDRHTHARTHIYTLTGDLIDQTI